MTAERRLLPTRRDRKGQRGYSIVELAIVLAVVGLLLGGAILPIGRQLEARAYKGTSEQIAEAIDAVVGYGITRRSPGVNVFYMNLGGSAVPPLDQMSFYGYRTVRVPEGRPYLPCPDTDGDGLEDRNPVYIPAAADPPGLRSGTEDRFAYRTGTGNSRSEFADSFAKGSNVSNDDLALGVCVSQHGRLPWATLGVRKTDRWGHELTYIVNPMFSTAAYGFDQDTRAMIFIPFYETAALVYPPNLPISDSYAKRGDAALVQTPMIVCEVSAARPCTPDNNLDLSSMNPTLTVRLSDDYGKYMADFLRNANIREVTDGLPFTIISHGPHCTSQVGFTTFEAEVDNNRYGNVCPGAPLIVTRFQDSSTSLNGTYSTTSTDSLFAPYNFVYATQRVPMNDWDPTPSAFNDLNNVPDNRIFDDLVGWLTRRELRERMQDAGVFPLPETFRGLYSGLAYFTSR